LNDYFNSIGLTVTVHKSPVPVDIKNSREETADEIRGRTLGSEAEKALRTLESHLIQRRSSKSTIKVYVSMLTLFLKYHADKNPVDITDDEIVDFIEEVIIANKYSASTQNQAISAIRTYYRILGQKRRAENLLRPRKAMTLPAVLSKEEIKLLLGSQHNIKHRLILMIIYSCGLRRGELINLRLKDLDRSRGLLHIMQGKGKVDRVVPVSDKIWKRIDEYMDAFRPVEYLIEGQTGGKYSAASVHNIFKSALRRAGIRKDLGVHSLRHSYATHLHESGLDIRYIQELLGHRSSRTTEIYTKVSRRNIATLKSPIDSMEIE
jgi:integrase/recombinase XerD